MDNWIAGKDYPEWMKKEALVTLSKGYTMKGESPRDMYTRVATSAAKYLEMPEMADRFFQYMWNGWLCPASPVLSNTGTERGLPISCFGLSVPDSIVGIYGSALELGVMTKSGGGVGICLSNVRGRGAPIRGGENGSSEGIVPWAKIYDSAIIGTSQGGVRRGAASVNLDVEHSDIEEFLRIRRPSGDANRQCLNLHHCVLVGDEWMQSMLDGDSHKRNIWIEILRARLETGEPYIMFKDTVNNANPQAYKQNNLNVEMTNICTEITLYTDALHSFICCLSSLNLAKWEEWKDTDVVEVSIYFLNGVLNEFIARAKNMEGMERAVRSAVKGRAIGLGVLGWHTLLQSEMTPMNSLRATLLNKFIFKNIKDKANKASKELAARFGEPEWCKGTGMYNSHLIALAPTRSNSLIAGGHSPSIEPMVANAFTDKTAKGVFTSRNPALEKLLETKGKNTYDVWRSIVGNQGSVQHLDFLTEDEKEVFLTAYEISQLALIKLAADRQPYIDQAQSLNLFFPADMDPKVFHQVHVEAWRGGVKTLYYCRSSSVLKADATSKTHADVSGDADCKSCEG
jgi:ribonucleoside-diphosphate reductase alpha chain